MNTAASEMKVRKTLFCLPALPGALVRPSHPGLRQLSGRGVLRDLSVTAVNAGQCLVQ
jgi:hypothetical protein